MTNDIPSTGMRWTVTQACSQCGGPVTSLSGCMICVVCGDSTCET